MNKEISFNKYKVKGADYHYQRIDKKNWKSFNAYMLARYQIELDLIKIILMQLKRDTIKILDVGCGDGVLFFLFNQKFKKTQYKLYGIDSSDLALKIAETKNPQVVFKNSEVHKLPFKDDNFDLVISSDVVEHLKYPTKMLREIQRVGKNNSFILIGTPIKYTKNPLDKLHVKEFLPHEFKEFLSEYFKNIKIIQSHRLEYRFLYRKKLKIFKIKLGVYRYFFNFLSIYFHRNPFLKIKTNDSKIYSYMFGMGKVKKR